MAAGAMTANIISALAITASVLICKMFIKIPSPAVGFFHPWICESARSLTLHHV